jgi:hypothetical protein
MLFVHKLFYLLVLVLFFSLLETFFNPTEDNQVENEPELYGNFLHITDFHPDPHYVNNITARSRCHQQNVGQANRPEFMLVGVSGPWGAPATICDSPPNLIDATFEWLEENWKNKLDFIIWTGDNSR